jgi:hypothetical protein
VLFGATLAGGCGGSSFGGGSDGGGSGTGGNTSIVRDGGAASDGALPPCGMPPVGTLVLKADADPGICICELPRPVSADNLDAIQLVVYGDAPALVPQDTNHADGWDFTDATQASIEIYGPTCADALAGLLRYAAVAYVCTM